MSEVCPIHKCKLEDFVSATEEGTEYFPYCPKCAESENKFWDELAKMEMEKK